MVCIAVNRHDHGSCRSVQGDRTVHDARNFHLSARHIGDCPHMAGRECSHQVARFVIGHLVVVEHLVEVPGFLDHVEVDAVMVGAVCNPHHAEDSLRDGACPVSDEPRDTIDMAGFDRMDVLPCGVVKDILRAETMGEYDDVGVPADDRLDTDRRFVSSGHICRNEVAACTVCPLLVELTAGKGLQGCTAGEIHSFMFVCGDGTGCVKYHVAFLVKVRDELPGTERTVEDITDEGQCLIDIGEACGIDPDNRHINTGKVRCRSAGLCDDDVGVKGEQCLLVKASIRLDNDGLVCHRGVDGDEPFVTCGVSVNADQEASLPVVHCHDHGRCRCIEAYHLLDVVRDGNGVAQHVGDGPRRNTCTAVVEVTGICGRC